MPKFSCRKVSECRRIRLYCQLAGWSSGVPIRNIGSPLFNRPENIKYSLEHLIQKLTDEIVLLLFARVSLLASSLLLTALPSWVTLLTAPCSAFVRVVLDCELLGISPAFLDDTSRLPELKF